VEVGGAVVGGWQQEKCGTNARNALGWMNPHRMPSREM